MKMIDVYMKMTNFEIGLGTKLIIGDYTFSYVKRWLSETSVSNRFEDGKDNTLEDYYDIDLNFLNKEVELIPSKPNKYLVKFNMRGLNEYFTYLNYSELRNCVMIDNKSEDEIHKIHFTKDELQYIQPVREFLKDMQGKYELIEVEDDEIY